MDEGRIKLNEDFEKAKSELKRMGKVVTKVITVSNNTFARVSIIINDQKYQSEHNDVMLATIHLRNQIK